MATDTVLVPGNTDVVVKGYVNASYLQRITVTPPPGSTGASIVLSGNGEGNVPIGEGHFTTPAGEDLTVTIDIEYSMDGGHSWQSPDIYSNLCFIEAFQLYVAVGEDHADEDYNDAICFVSWAQPGNTSIGVVDVNGVRREDARDISVGSTVVDLEAGLSVDVRSYADASYVQRVTLTPQGANPLVWTGQGFYDVPLGSTTLNTGSAGTSVTVAVDHSTDGGATWTPSQVAQESCVIGNYRLVVVASEDSSNDTWDDATTYFAWTVPTSLRKSGTPSRS